MVDKKIPDLDPAANSLLSDEYEITQSGISKRASGTQIKEAFNNMDKVPSATEGAPAVFDANGQVIEGTGSGGVIRNKDLDTPSTSILDIENFEQFTKISTVGANQQFSITNEILTYFKLILFGGSVNTTLFTHATKTVNVTWEAGALEQYEPTETNNLRFEVQKTTPNIEMVGTIVNESNQIDTTETPIQVKTASFTAVGGIPYRIEGTTALVVTVPTSSGDRLSIVNASSEIATIGALGNLSVGDATVLYYDATWKEYTNRLI